MVQQQQHKAAPKDQKKIFASNLIDSLAFVFLAVPPLPLSGAFPHETCGLAVPFFHTKPRSEPTYA